MTTPDEVQRAVERITRYANYIPTDPFNAKDLRLLLSERAELLAAVERMQNLLEQMADLLQIANRSTDRPSGYVSRIVIAARAALTTGEEK